jgi:DNA polymerase-3 subunit epsilon
MCQLELDRPLAVLDIEATGISPRADRIVELVIVKMHPGGERTTHRYRVNPGQPIPPEATAIHGITDEDVADCPAFADIAVELAAVLEDCDLCGYNMIRFDLPMLGEEFLRAGVDFDAEDRRLVDAQRIFHRREPRDLSAALAFYCGKDHVDAHGAEADVLATIEVLEGELRMYADLPRRVAELHDYCNPRDSRWVDRSGRLKWVNNEVVLNFGRKKGTRLRDVVENDPNFIKWMLRSDFPRDVRTIVEKACAGEWPTPPAGSGG